MIGWGPVLISKSAGAPPYFVQYVENAKTAGKKIIAITIDLCAPTSGYKSSIPEYLVTNNIKATFFLGSGWATAFSDGFNYIKSHNSLFEIGNHTKTHPSGTSQIFWDGAGTQAEMDTQWKDSQAWFTSHGVTPRVCRLPVAAPTRMEKSGSIKFLKTASPCTEFIQYSMWPGDGSNDLSFIKSHLKVGRGEILLIHGGKDITANNLPSIVSYLKEQGYQFLTVSELLSQYGG
jgi:peptidoglycan/xylan/chitin deacetylase (PgdA/CDA1 family)